MIPMGAPTMGGSSGGSCALIMAWYHPEWYHAVLTYSGTYVNQQWPYDPKTPHGAWEFHEHSDSRAAPAKPLRIWMEVGDRDNLNMNALHDGYHDWVLAKREHGEGGWRRRAITISCLRKHAGHHRRAVKQQTLPEALEYVWARLILSQK